MHTDAKPLVPTRDLDRPLRGIATLSLTRQKLFVLHGWFGLNFGLLLFIVCFSGAIATLTHEIEWLTEPALRIRPDGPVRWQASYEALQKAYPEHSIGGLGRGERVVTDGLAWVSYINSPDGNWGQVRIDPYTAELVRPSTRLYLTDFMRQLHYNFLSQAGFYLVCFLAFPLLFSMVTGLLFYKRWWRHLCRLQTRKGTHAFLSSLHRLIGVWSLIFGVIIAVTGIWYLVEKDLVPREIAYPSAPKVPAEKLARHGPGPKLLPLDEYVTLARKAYPELEPLAIDLPDGPEAAIAVRGQAGHLMVRDRANAVFLDPFDGEVIHVQRVHESGAIRRWVDMADSLHFGYFGGITTKILWALLGISVPVSILSGAYLSFRRAGLFVRNDRSMSKRARPLPPLLRYPIRSWMTLLILIAITWTNVQGYYDRKELSVATTTELGEIPIGPWKASLSRNETVYPGNTTDYFIRFNAGENRLANFKRAALWLGNGKSGQGELSGQTHSMRARVPTPAVVSDITEITISVEDWTGREHIGKISDAIGRAPLVVLKPGETKPKSTTNVTQPLTWGFLTVLWGFVLITTAVAIIWLIMDRRADGGSSPGKTAAD